jgi:hypothetical protein
VQFQVPQFIETEDKIVGPISIRQFIYLVVAAGISIILYFSVQPWLWIILSLPLLGFGAAMAFVKVNGRPFSKFLFAGLSYYWKPQTYVWQPDQPKLPKTAEAVKESVGFSVEKLFAGMALKKAWGTVQVGQQAPEAKPVQEGKERYQIFHKITGEHEAAKRVDYR